MADASKRPTLTTSAGIPVEDNQNSLTAGSRGPLLVQDWQLFEKHAHFRATHVTTLPLLGDEELSNEDIARALGVRVS